MIPKRGKGIKGEDGIARKKFSRGDILNKTLYTIGEKVKRKGENREKSRAFPAPYAACEYGTLLHTEASLAANKSRVMYIAALLAYWSIQEVLHPSKEVSKNLSGRIPNVISGETVQFGDQFRSL